MFGRGVNVAAGAYSLTAVATDNNGATTTSAAVPISVNATPTVSITAPTANAIFNAPATITVTANAADTDGTITKVDFYQGATLIGTATAVPYSVQWADVAAGSYSLTAIATDNQGATTTSAPVPITVNAPPTESITAPAANASFNAPATITVTANAADADGTVAKVDFYQGTTLIGTATAAPYSITWANVAAGAYSLIAIATDNNGATTTSAAVPITVKVAVALYFIHPDHLGTPRLIADANQNTVWRWDNQEPFGNNPPNEDPDSNSVAFDFPLRFPGQYADRETNLAYNYFRDYSPEIGRYVESDPIGLEGGLNTYAYVDSDPLSFVDQLGLTGQLPTPTCKGRWVFNGWRVDNMGLNPGRAEPRSCTCSWTCYDCTGSPIGEATNSGMTRHNWAVPCYSGRRRSQSCPPDFLNDCDCRSTKPGPEVP